MELQSSSWCNVSSSMSHCRILNTLRPCLRGMISWDLRSLVGVFCLGDRCLSILVLAKVCRCWVAWVLLVLLGCLSCGSLGLSWGRGVSSLLHKLKLGLRWIAAFDENVWCWCSSVIEGLECAAGLGSEIGLEKDIIDNRNELWTQARSFMQDCDEWALCFIPTAGTLETCVLEFAPASETTPSLPRPNNYGQRVKKWTSRCPLPGSGRLRYSASKIHFFLLPNTRRSLGSYQSWKWTECFGKFGSISNSGSSSSGGSCSRNSIWESFTGCGREVPASGPKLVGCNCACSG